MEKIYGAIKDPLFHERVILGEDLQKELLKEYLSLFPNMKSASESLGLNLTTFFAYLKYQNKSIPKKVFEVVASRLGIEDPSKLIREKTTLKEIRSKFLKEFWRNDRERALKVARKAAPLGIKKLEKKKGKSRKEIMKEVRSHLYNKYGLDAHRVIGNLRIEKAKREFGKNWKMEMIKPAMEKLKEKYGEKYWEVLLPKARAALEKKYGPLWALRLSRRGMKALREKFGENWREITLERARKKLKEKYGEDVYHFLSKLSKETRKVKSFASKRMDMKEEERKCYSCGSTNLIKDHETGETVCADCGLVQYEASLDMGPEWRAFDEEQKKARTRVGPPQSHRYHDKGLGTTIGWMDKDAHGKSLKPEQKAQAFRLRKWQKRARVQSSDERNIAYALTLINGIGENLNLPSQVLDNAYINYKKAVKRKLIRGRSIQQVAAATVYLACRLCGINRTLEEVAEAASLKKKDVGKQYRFIVKEFEYWNIPQQKASNYVSRLCSSMEQEEISYKILNAAKKANLTSGRGPIGIAAAATYIAGVLCGKKVTQREIAERAGVTEVTIRNRYKDLMDELLFEISL